MYRGHKDQDYKKSKYKALSFSENKDLAAAYGLGANDQSNPAVADGFVTTVEFNGTITKAAENGLGDIDLHMHKYLSADCVRFKDGVFGVLNLKCLTIIKTEKA